MSELNFKKYYENYIKNECRAVGITVLHNMTSHREYFVNNNTQGSANLYKALESMQYIEKEAEEFVTGERNFIHSFITYILTKRVKAISFYDILVVDNPLLHAKHGDIVNGTQVFQSNIDKAFIYAVRIKAALFDEKELVFFDE